MFGEGAFDRHAIDRRLVVVLELGVRGDVPGVALLEFEGSVALPEGLPDLLRHGTAFGEALGARRPS